MLALATLLLVLVIVAILASVRANDGMAHRAERRNARSGGALARPEPRAHEAALATPPRRAGL
jgi:hypothetical protein